MDVPKKTTEILRLRLQTVSGNDVNYCKTMNYNIQSNVSPASLTLKRTQIPEVFSSIRPLETSKNRLFLSKECAESSFDCREDEVLPHQKTINYTSQMRDLIRNRDIGEV